jgi:hypothetical protein
VKQGRTSWKQGGGQGFYYYNVKVRPLVTQSYNLNYAHNERPERSSRSADAARD